MSEEILKMQIKRNFDTEEYSLVLKIIEQLQAYKNKEDKLRNLLNNNTLENIKCDCNCLRNFVGNMEQILNEGSDQE